MYLYGDHRDGNNPIMVTARMRRAAFNRMKLKPEFQQWKRRQYLIQGKKCAWCMLPISRTFKNVHVDHALPLYHGGTNSYDNLVLAHAKCNVKKWVRIDGLPQWILNNQRKFELDELHAKQQKLLDQATEDAWQERFAWWLRSWIYLDR